MEFFEQMLRFVWVGVMATITDFLGYNLFLRYVKQGVRVLASMCSVTLAMMVSFSWNHLWVFGGLDSGGWPVGEFLLVTLVSAYGIQSAVIYFLSRKRRVPARITIAVSEILHAKSESVAKFLERNAVKAAAVVAGLIWNFSWYRWYVFA